MSDRELLELAAKAAGINGVWHEEWKCLTYLGSPAIIGGQIRHVWTPLTDDGDALRLAVKLELDVMQRKDCVMVDDASMDRPIICVRYGDDSAAATRRAIVRAAAEIGRRPVSGM